MGALTEVRRAPFGALPDGRAVAVFTLANEHGVEARILDYGAIIAALRVPDRAGRLANVVLGFDALAGYLATPAYVGAVVGRYANRIAGGRFRLDGRTHHLVTNNGPHHLHGGALGFDKVVWQAAPRPGATALELSHVSRDGDEGYPGTLRARVVYSLDADNRLAVDFSATADRATPVNLSQHSYFNLSGRPEAEIGDHLLTLRARHYTPVDATLIPTGEIAPVAGTPFDFTAPAPIGARLAADHAQLRGGGYDHNFVLEPAAPDVLRLAARVEERDSGRVLEVHTTEPGVQLYTARFADWNGGGPRHAFCLETQHFPDSPNRPEFPPVILRPGREYRSRTVFAFSVK